MPTEGPDYSLQKLDDSCPARDNYVRCINVWCTRTGCMHTYNYRCGLRTRGREREKVVCVCVGGRRLTSPSTFRIDIVEFRIVSFHGLFEKKEGIATIESSSRKRVEFCWREKN